jgi:hypothetical protein
MVREAKYHCVYAVRGMADREHLPHIDTNRRRRDDMGMVQTVRW